MKRILLLGSKDTGRKNDVAAMAATLTMSGLEAEVQVGYWEDLLFTIANDELSVTDTASGSDVASADLVLALNWYKTGKLGFYRDMAFALALYLEQKGTKFWNTEMRQQRSTTKLSTLLQLTLQGIPVPKTLFSLNRQSLLDHQLGFPCVVKTIAGSRGSANHLAHNDQELRALLDTDDVVPYMIEEFIPNDHDLRVVCYAGEPALVIRRSRTSQDTHLNNTSQGATATILQLTEIDDTIVYICRTACCLLGRELAGVDILLANDGTGRTLCLEVNAIPQLTSGSYVPEKSARLAEVLNEYLKGDA